MRCHVSLIAQPGFSCQSINLSCGFDRQKIAIYVFKAIALQAGITGKRKLAITVPLEDIVTGSPDISACIQQGAVDVEDERFPEGEFSCKDYRLLVKCMN